MNNKSVLLVEDHPLVALMMSDILKEQAEEIDVLKVESLKAGQAYSEQSPDLVIFDLNLPDSRGVATARRIRFMFPFSKVLAFTGATEGETYTELEEMGIPFIAKTAKYKDIVDTLRPLLGFTGQQESKRQAAMNRMRTYENNSQIIAPGAAKPLTKRQVAIMRLLVTGLGAKEVARELGLSPETIKTHTREIFVRLGATNRAHAVSIFLKAERQSQMLELI